MMLNIFRIIFVSFLFVSAHCHPLEPVIQIDEQQNDIIDEIIDLSHIGPLMYGEPDERVGKALVEWTPENNSNPEELGSYFEGDMLLPRAEGRNGIVSTASRWPNGIIPYTFQPGFGAESVIRQAIAEYHSKTCLRFVPRTTEKDWIQFENSQTGCWSSVGRVGRRQAVNLQVPGCTTKIGTALHEIMHAVGFLHEQNRSDRDGFVTVVTQNIKEGKT